jgi:hypothetical protein
MRSLASRLILAALIFLGGSASLHAENITVAGRTLSIDLPPSYCVLDRSDPAEDEMFRIMERIQAGMNRVLVVFYDCAELARMRRGESNTFDRYGQILTPIREQAYPGITREVYFAELTKVFDRAFAIGARLGQENIGEVIPEIQIGEARSLGVLETDEAALYAGMLEKIAFEGEEFTVAAVISMTLVKDVPVSVNLYRPYEGDASIDLLLMEQQRFLRRLVQENEVLESRLAPVPGPSANGS